MCLWDAIDEMRRLSKQGIPFSFVFYTYDRQRQVGGRRRKIYKALLNKQPKESQVRDANHKLFFIDLKYQQHLACWQILVVEFNDVKLTI
jgi:hypothetical protein